MYSIVQACWKWKHDILGKGTIIHTDHKPLQFMQMQGKLHNDYHQKWFAYLQQFHLNIKYKKGITNQVTNYLSSSPVATLTMVLDSCGHENLGWSQLYVNDQLHYYLTNVERRQPIVNFQLQDGLLYHYGHLCIPLSKIVKLIWEAHYNWVEGHFGVDKTMEVLQKYFYCPKLLYDVNKYIISCTAYAIAKPIIKKQGLYTPLSAPNKP